MQIYLHKKVWIITFCNVGSVNLYEIHMNKYEEYNLKEYWHIDPGSEETCSKKKLIQFKTNKLVSVSGILYVGNFGIFCKDTKTNKFCTLCERRKSYDMNIVLVAKYIMVQYRKKYIFLWNW